MSFEIDVSCQSTKQQVNLKLLQAAIEHGLQVEAVESAILSITVVDNAAIHLLNKQHLNHDYPTDVISFQLDWTCDDPNMRAPHLTPAGRSTGCRIEGEIIVSAEYAADAAAAGGWSTQDEVTLYTIHGLLHICGYDDLTAAEKEIMRTREAAVLFGLGLKPVYPSDHTSTIDSEDDEPPGSTLNHPDSPVNTWEDDQ